MEEGAKELMRLFKERISDQSDINEHVTYLAELAKECQYIAEFGTRSGVSTTAFLYAQPKELHLFDLTFQFLNLDLRKYIDKQKHTKVQFYEQDTKHSMLHDNVDLLFLDTQHTFEQVRAELLINHQKVNKYIVIHDTVTFGRLGETGGPGVWKAITQFLAMHWKYWTIANHRLHNNGLLTLQRWGV